MANETRITVVGNLVAEPELRKTQSGLSVLSVNVASTPRTFDRTANDWVDGETLYIRLNIWRELADHVARSLTKGSRVIVTGALSIRSYDDKDGVKRTSTEMEVDEIGPSLRHATANVQKAPSNQGQRSATPPATDEPWAQAQVPAGVSAGANDLPF